MISVEAKPRSSERLNTDSIADKLERTWYRHFGRREVQGPIDVSRDGIPIHNRSWTVVLHNTFFDDPSIDQHINLRDRKKLKKFNYSFEYLKIGSPPVTRKEVIFGISDFFQPGFTVVDVGCGPGSAAIGAAAMHPEVKVIGFDYEMGERIKPPKTSLTNVEFRNDNWREMSTFPDDTVDAWISDQAIALYKLKEETVKQLTRASKIGAVFRATGDRVRENDDTFGDMLARHGWEVYDITWILENGDRIPSNIICAKLISK